MLELVTHAQPETDMSEAKVSRLDTGVFAAAFLMAGLGLVLGQSTRSSFWDVPYGVLFLAGGGMMIAVMFCWNQRVADLARWLILAASIGRLWAVIASWAISPDLSVPLTPVALWGVVFLIMWRSYYTTVLRVRPT